MSALNLQREGQGRPCKDAEFFEFLKSALQPRNDATLDSIVTGVMMHLLPPPEFRNSLLVFLDVVFDPSLQIPYDHPSMDKLVGILDALFKRESFNSMESLGVVDADEVGSAEYTNASSFLARLEALSLPDGIFQPGGAELHLGGWLRDQYHGSFDYRQGLTMAATQWILRCGRILSDYFFNPARYPTIHKKSFTLPKWQEYRRGFEAFADGDRDEAEFTYSEECKSLASRAAAEMSSLEQEAGIEDAMVEGQVGGLMGGDASADASS